MSHTASRPLDGYVILDFSRLIAGPSATDILSTLGARVIKVESPGGDPMRLTRSTVGGDTASAPTFAAYNTGKESIVLDLKDESDHRIAVDLIRRADVVVESFRPGVMDRLGLGAHDVHRLNPDIVYASLSAFGSAGPDRTRGGVDIVLQAETGLMSVTGEAGGGPVKVGTPITDAASAYVLALGIVSSLLGRQRHGTAVGVDVSMFAVGVHLQAQQFAEYLQSGIEPPRVGNRAPYAAPADVFSGADGDFVLSAHIAQHWRRLCEVLEHPEWVDDPRFVDVEQRVNHRDELNAALGEVLAQRPADEWVHVFRQHGLTAGRVASYRDVIDSDNAAALGLVVDAQDIDGQPLRLIRPPFRLTDSDTPQQPGRRVPGLDADRTQILAQLQQGDDHE